MKKVCRIKTISQTFESNNLFAGLFANLSMLGTACHRHLNGIARSIEQILFKHTHRLVYCNTIAARTIYPQRNIIHDSDNGYTTSILKLIGDCSTGGPARSA